MISAINQHIEDRLSRSGRIRYRRSRERAIKITRAILRHRTAKYGLIILVFFTVLAIVGPHLAPYDPTRYFKDQNGIPLALQPPSRAHPFGTTHLGRDVLSQWMIGVRVSIVVGALSGISVMIVGTTVGVVSGYYRGRTDLVLMRVVDVLYGIPATPLILILALFFGANIWNIILAFILILWRTMARIIRSQVMSLAERPFVKAAKATGASDFRIMSRHILPNLLPLIFIETTIIIGAAIALEAGLSFLGMGATRVISWGTMLQLTFSSGAIREAWWWVLPPGIGITLMVMSFYYVSRAIEEITNPEVTGGVR